MVNKPDIDARLPRAVMLARIWLLLLGCAWLFAGFFVATAAGGSRGWGLALIAVGVLHFAVARYARARLAVFLSLLGP
jgi:hypothetical protein